MKTYYCEPTNIDRPVWALRITVASGKVGFILGRWEAADQRIARGAYQHWFVATTAIDDVQFNRSKLRPLRSVSIEFVRVVNELEELRKRNVVVY